MFSGSYLKEDITFLLKIIDIDETSIEKKESFIQSGKRHYSEMISPEYVPTKEYLDIFYSSFEMNKNRVAKDVLSLAKYIYSFNKEAVLVSLARAGTPVGVLLKRSLRDIFGVDLPHYSISIIRDRGVDSVAIDSILEDESKKRGISKRELSEKLIFIDGWTGKGVIKKELKKFVEKYNKENGVNLLDKLFVLADISGKADVASTMDDYMIPSSALNSTVSGLVSRTVLNREFVGKNEFHGCKYYREFEDFDLSLWYVDELMKIIKSYKENDSLNKVYVRELYNDYFKELEDRCDVLLRELMEEYKIKNVNFIKPGIGETTRVLLRRKPHKILVRDKNLKGVEHLIQLSKDRGVEIEEVPELLYQSIGIIKEL